MSCWFGCYCCSQLCRYAATKLHVLSSKKNQVSSKCTAKNSDPIVLYTSSFFGQLQNPQVVIAQQDHFLLNYTTDDIQRMSGCTRKKLAQNLETVQKALATEALQRKQGQGVITSYFKRIHSTRVHPYYRPDIVTHDGRQTYGHRYT